MRILLNRHAAPFITSLFLVLLVWGSALFFHVVPAGFHGMHEWLSLLLILSFALHPWKNRRPMTSYLRHAPMGVALAASAALAEVLLLPGGSGDGRQPGVCPAWAGSSSPAPPNWRRCWRSRPKPWPPR